MYSQIIVIDKEHSYTIEDNIDFPVSSNEISNDRNSLKDAHKKIHKKHHTTRGILVETLSIYLSISLSLSLYIYIHPLVFIKVCFGKHITKKLLNTP